MVVLLLKSLLLFLLLCIIEQLLLLLLLLRLSKLAPWGSLIYLNNWGFICNNLTVRRLCRMGRKMGTRKRVRRLEFERFHWNLSSSGRWRDSFRAPFLNATCSQFIVQFLDTTHLLSCNIDIVIRHVNFEVEGITISGDFFNRNLFCFFIIGVSFPRFIIAA